MDSSHFKLLNRASFREYMSATHSGSGQPLREACDGGYGFDVVCRGLLENGQLFCLFNQRVFKAENFKGSGGNADG